MRAVESSDGRCASDEREGWEGLEVGEALGDQPEVTGRAGDIVEGGSADVIAGVVGEGRGARRLAALETRWGSKGEGCGEEREKSG